MLGELFGAESKGQVYGHLHSYLYDNASSTSTLSKLQRNPPSFMLWFNNCHYGQPHIVFVLFTETICYDDGCHLKRYATNPTRSALTVTASRLAPMNFVIDRMHYKGHIDPWCHEHCNPQKLKDLENVS